MKSLDKKVIAIDWKKFGSIDLNGLSEEIENNTNSVINEFGTYIAFCDIEEEFDISQLDKNFVKLFKFSQIIVRFLCKEYIRLMSSENEIKSNSNLIRENKKLRKLLEIHQKAMTYNRTLTGDYVQCPNCPKVFFDSNFLKTHFARRHPKESLDSEGMLSLTNKIDKYQRVLIGDNKGLDKLKNEIQVLTEKLEKTESNLLTEKDERIRLEERIEYVMKVRDNEMQQILREELEEMKFIQRERDIENDVQSSNKDIDIDNSESVDKSEEQNQNLKSFETNKIEELISIQAKEMIKLGNNVQKLVSHLTDSLPENIGQTLNPRPLISALIGPKIKTQNIIENVSEERNRREEAIEVKKAIEEKPIPDKNIRNDSKEFISEESQSIDKMRKTVELRQVFNEVEKTLTEKLNSFGVDINSSPITEDIYLNALKKANEERSLLIQQNRFEYDFEAIEQQISKFVDKKVSEKSSQSLELSKVTVPEVKVRKLSIETDQQMDRQTQKVAEKKSIEAIVHMTQTGDSLVENNDKNMNNKIESIERTLEVNSFTENLEIQPKSPKSSLKSIISEKKINDENRDKEKKRIRFSEHRIEHQISPEESSEDTSEEYSPMVADNGTYVTFDKNRQFVAPIPAQRTHKNNLTLDLNSESNDQTNDDSSEDTNYEIDDQLMDEILQTNAYVREGQSTETGSDLRSTKVQELAQMIEQQLNKRSVAHKKPPIGSVNVMSANKQSLSRFPNNKIDSDESD